MKFLVLTVMLILAVSAVGQDEGMKMTEKDPVIFVVSVVNEVQLERAYGLVESLRTFGGKYKDAPIWVYGIDQLIDQKPVILKNFPKLGVEIKSVSIPKETGWYYLAQMVATAAKAERDAEGKADIIVFLGSDTIVLDEPGEFIIQEGISLGYRSVMHKNICPLFSEPLDTYWKKAYEIMKVDESKVFPMITPADDDTIRPYFNASCQAVRPEKGLFRIWAENFSRLCKDSVIKSECEKDQMKRVFTFQVALTGTYLNNLDKDEMYAISGKYNYPIFFKEMFGANKDFHDITGITTIRYEQFFDQPIPGWEKILKGPADRIAWIKDHYVK